MNTLGTSPRSTEPALLLPRGLLLRVSSLLESGDTKEAIVLLEGFQSGVKYSIGFLAGKYTEEMIQSFLRNLEEDLDNLRMELNGVDGIQKKVTLGTSALFTPEQAAVMTKS